MLITYTLTVQLLARQRQNLGGGKPTSGGWSSGWLGIAPPALGEWKNGFQTESEAHKSVFTERKNTWKRFIKSSLPSTPNHAHSAGSTDTELSTLDINTHELWLPESRYSALNACTTTWIINRLSFPQHTRPDSVDDDSAPSIRSRNAEAVEGTRVVCARQRVVRWQLSAIGDLQLEKEPGEAQSQRRMVCAHPQKP